jgi:hypothetical protein
MGYAIDFFLKKERKKENVYKIKHGFAKRFQYMH